MAIIMSNKKITPVPELKSGRTPKKIGTDKRITQEYEKLCQSAQKARKVWQRDPGSYNFGVNDAALIQAALDEIYCISKYDDPIIALFE